MANIIGEFFRFINRPLEVINNLPTVIREESVGVSKPTLTQAEADEAKRVKDIDSMPRKYRRYTDTKS